MGNPILYNLVHVTTGGEYKAPLVASQLFDQAECQAENREGFAPGKVCAWIIEPMRTAFAKQTKEKVNALRKRCPHISISVIGGISRLGDWPLLPLLAIKREKLDTIIPVIYHCRGEGAAELAMQMKAKYPQDKVVLDLRGYWPAEMLYNRGIHYVENAEGKDKDDYEAVLERLKRTIAKVDACTAVSSALKDIMIDLGARQSTTVVPCCVKSITTPHQRKQLRNKWNIADDETVIAYSGTTAAYQHIEDLTIPFIKKLMNRDAKIKLMILTPELEKFKAILLAAGIVNNVILESFPQKDVAAALTAADIGVLIRKTTLVNTVANPVKVAEYLASGLALIVEYGIGGISQGLYDTSVAKGISISKDGADMEHEADIVGNWLGQHLYKNGDDAREIAKNEYSWLEMINVHRKTYLDLLSSNTK